ncbi:hypothetical protein EJ03DRAFT_353950 [Teratosphaeria nubilosa]|uniref:Uncharacterized protein n=1 Tax=Teratosphaeria nubilosa TaxID=161662 RepID=A0A6G1L2J2_9PEZI|nr:hypothetical protein EJ03DRAFT_353950 [Teratosphaeria nubilosa]
MVLIVLLLLLSYYTGSRVFQYLIPLTFMVANLIVLAVQKHITYYGIVLDIFGAFQIRILERLARPDCEAATKMLHTPLVCDVETFKQWLALAHQPNGLARMMEELPGRVVGLGVSWLGFCWYSFWAVRDFEERNRRDEREDPDILDAKILEEYEAYKGRRVGQV